jgi:hypothetical protein
LSDKSLNGEGKGFDTMEPAVPYVLTTEHLAENFRRDLLKCLAGLVIVMEEYRQHGLVANFGIAKDEQGRVCVKGLHITKVFEWPAGE